MLTASRQHGSISNNEATAKVAPESDKGLTANRFNMEILHQPRIEFNPVEPLPSARRAVSLRGFKAPARQESRVELLANMGPRRALSASLYGAKGKGTRFTVQWGIPRWRGRQLSLWNF